jgi:4-oxalocrotonate tautomerase
MRVSADARTVAGSSLLLLDRRHGAGEEQKGTPMPFIDVKVLENVLTDDEKQTIAARIAEAFISVAGEPARPVTHVVVEDVPSGLWSIGGQPLTSEGVREMLGRTPVSV